MTDIHDRPVEAQRTRRVAVVYNPVKIDLDHVREVVHSAARDGGWAEPVWFETSESDPGAGATQEALKHRPEVVIAAGGDGTVRAVAEVVAGSDAALALLPSGTGNLLARNLNVPLNDVSAAVDLAFGQDEWAIDVGEITIRRVDGSRERRSFLVMAGVGLDAKMPAATDDELKKKASWLAYVKAIAVALRDQSNLGGRIQLDERPARRLSAHTVIDANCGSLPGKILLLPEAQVDDGVLDVVMFRPKHLLGWVQIITKVFWENGIVDRVRFLRRFRTPDTDALRYLKGRRFRAQLSKPEQIELDGDEFGTTTGFAVRLAAGHLTIRAPQPAPRTQS